MQSSHPQASLYNLILSGAGLVAWQRDATGRLVHVGDGIEALTGCSAASILAGAAGWTDLLLAEDARRYQECLEAMQAGGQLDFSYRIRTQGKVRWLREWGCRLAEGAPGFGGYLQDVSATQEQSQEIHTLTDHLGILGQTNQAVMRCHHANELFRHICDVLTQEGRFEAAWVCQKNGGLSAAAGLPPALRTLIEEQVAAPEASPLARQMAAKMEFAPLPMEIGGLPWLAEHLPQGRELMLLPLREEGVLTATLGLVSNADKPFDYGEMALLYGMTVDISFALDIYAREAERQQAEDRLHLSAKVFENSREGILITDAARRIISVNRAFTEITGYEAEEAIGQSPKMLSSGLHGPDFFDELITRLEADGGWQGEVWNRRKSGELYPELLGISEVRDRQGEVTNYIGVFSDVTEQHASRNRLEFLAHHDALTGLPNRLLLKDRVERAIAGARRLNRPLALVFLDLDNFKSINDSLGHQVGDQMLIALVGRLRSCLREMDTLSRLGGDEFVVVLPDILDARAAAIVAEKIMGAVETPIQLGEIAVSSSFSMGIALYPDHGEDFDTLLKNADAAMYHAKERGKNAYSFYEESISAGSVVKLALQGRLHGAAERGELRLVYQPQMDIQSGRIIGAEALLRWQSPEFGAVSPGEFIPVAEESGLIVGIGAWVLEEVCRQIRDWIQAGQRPVPVAVNISPIQFLRGNLISTVAALLERYQIPPRCLDIEITESTMVDDSPHVLRAVHSLRDMGLMLSVDDFGTGYSNLGRLRQFNANKLKVDQSFVRAMEKEEEGIIMVRTIIQMAKNLKLETIAEGVETNAQLAILTELGCEQIQGYLFSRPVSPDDFASLMAADHIAIV